MEPDLATELLEEVEFLKKFVGRSRQRICKISDSISVLDKFDGITNLLQLLDDILALPFTDVLTVATSEDQLQLQLQLGSSPTNESHVDDGDHDSVDDGVEVDEEMRSSPSPEDDDEQFCNVDDDEDFGIIEQPIGIGPSFRSKVGGDSVFPNRLATLEINTYDGDFGTYELSEVEMDMFKQLLLEMDGMDRVTIHKISFGEDLVENILTFMESNNLDVGKFRLYDGSPYRVGD
ncbi:DNA mismatch repair protein Msh6 [Folsomia candida]|uniref:DNA mismatch repair protein Msh6 n=1 Tax=Folsomia candida TaxID=158441 RepID=A0A226DRH8_FOLCA|nr:DNA mismatch repair protein Msh6 [Folsomia candida]